MSDNTIGLDCIENQMLAYDISDETLEAAAGTSREKARNMTLFFCTYLDICPGP